MPRASRSPARQRQDEPPNPVALELHGEQPTTVYLLPGQDHDCPALSAQADAAESRAEASTGCVHAFDCAACRRYMPGRHLPRQLAAQLLRSVLWRDGRPHLRAAFEAHVLCWQCRVRRWFWSQGPAGVFRLCARLGLCTVHIEARARVHALNGTVMELQHVLCGSGAWTAVDWIVEVQAAVADSILRGMQTDGSMRPTSVTGRHPRRTRWWERATVSVAGHGAYGDSDV